MYKNVQLFSGGVRGLWEILYFPYTVLRQDLASGYCTRILRHLEIDIAPGYCAPEKYFWQGSVVAFKAKSYRLLREAVLWSKYQRSDSYPCWANRLLIPFVSLRFVRKGKLAVGCQSILGASWFWVPVELGARSSRFWVLVECQWRHQKLGGPPCH